MADSSKQLTIGLVSPGGGSRTPAELEDLPIDSLWVGGHVASRNPTPEAMVALAMMAAQTHRVRIGTSVLLLPLYPPAVVAKQLADLDRAVGGRVAVGVGVGGEYPQEFRACHIPIEERGRRMDEMIPLLRKMWTAETFSHSGCFYGMEDVRIHPAPAQESGPPILVAGRAEVAMRRAAAVGDGWMPYLYSPQRYAASVDVIRQQASDRGRDISSFEWCAWLFVHVDEDRELAKRRIGASLSGIFRDDLSGMVDRLTVAGDVDDVVERLREFYDAGARTFILCPVGSNEPDLMVDLIAAKVIPALRSFETVRAPVR